MAKLLEQQKARELRLKGKSINFIAKELSVSKSSVSLWVRDIQLPEKQKKSLKENSLKHLNPQYRNRDKARNTYMETFRNRRLSYQMDGRKKAREKNALHIAGCMLYWAEGTKSRSVIQFTNSDKNMMKFFIKFLRESLGINDKKISIKITCYDNNDLTVEEIENYWINNLNLKSTNLNKTSVNNTPKSSKQMRNHKLPYGVCRIQVNSVKDIQHIYGAIQEYCGFENPEWLNKGTVYHKKEQK